MSTFQELQSKLATARYRKAILEYLVQHLDAEFRPSASTPSKKKLLTEDRREVPDDTFENEVAFLLEDIQALNEEIATILATTLTPPASEPSVVPGEPKKKSKPKTESTTQGEVQ